MESVLGQALGTLGQAGQGPRELTGVRDLTAVDDRSSLAVLQQRPNDNFNLLDPATDEHLADVPDGGAADAVRAVEAAAN